MEGRNILKAQQNAHLMENQHGDLIATTHTEICTKIFVGLTLIWITFLTQKVSWLMFVLYYWNSKDITNTWLCFLWNLCWIELKMIWHSCGIKRLIPNGNKVTVEMKHYFGTNIESKGIFMSQRCTSRAVWEDHTVT